MSGCRGACTGEDWHKINSWVFKRGLKICGTCNMAVKCEGGRCPCCSKPLRVTPRNAPSRKKWSAAAPRIQ